MSAINPEYISNVIETIEKISDCNSLRKYEEQVIKRLISLLTDTLNSSTAFADLITPPTDIGEVITWIENFIDLYIGGPYAKLIALETELLGNYATILGAFAGKLASISCLQNFNGMNSMGGFDFGSSGFGG